MPPIRPFLSQHKFEAHTIAFLMMILSPIGLYFAAQSGAEAIIWILLSVVILANLLVVLVP